jgi:hypothetical protein
MHILYPEYLVLLIALVAFFGAWWQFGRQQNTLKNTQLDARSQLASRLGGFLHALTWACKTVVWAALVLAFCVTIVPFARYVFEDSGIVFWAVDTSSSMPMVGVADPHEISLAANFNPKFKDYKPETPGGSGYMYGQRAGTVPTRFDTALGAIKYIAEHDTHLRMGLFAADDQTYKIYPATKDHTVLIDELQALYDYGTNVSSGDNFCGVTSDGDAIGTGPTAVEFFKSRPKNEPHVFAFFSDGDFMCSDEMQHTLKKQFADENISLIVFAVGNQWFDNEGKNFDEFIKLVGGHRYVLSDQKSFEEGLAFVNKVAHDGMHKERQGDEQDSLLLLMEIAAAAFVLYLALLLIRRSRQ